MSIQNLPVIQPTPQPSHAGCWLLHKIGVRDCQVAPDGKCREFALRVVQPALVVAIRSVRVQVISSYECVIVGRLQA
jgi:hypothetical protein